MKLGEIKMKITKDNAMKLWNEKHGKETKVRDSKGREILKAAYGQKGSEYGWDIDHIVPKGKGGTGKKDNLQIVHIETNQEKGDK